MIDKNTIEDGLQQAVKNDYNLKQIIRGRDYSEGFKKGAEWAIEQLQPKWIDVKEQLPDFGGQYNVIHDLEDGGEPVSSCMEFDGITKEWKYVGTDLIASVITHWMELPITIKQK